MKRRMARCVLSAGLGTALVAAVLVGGAGAAVAIPRYVAPSPTGNDIGGANDCLSPFAPCATIQHAIDVADPTDVLRIAGGTFYGSGGSVAVITAVRLPVGSSQRSSPTIRASSHSETIGVSE